MPECAFVAIVWPLMKVGEHVSCSNDAALFPVDGATVGGFYLLMVGQVHLQLRVSGCKSSAFR